MKLDALWCWGSMNDDTVRIDALSPFSELCGILEAIISSGMGSASVEHVSLEIESKTGILFGAVDGSSGTLEVDSRLLIAKSIRRRFL